MVKVAALVGRAVGAAIVAAVVLVPRVTIADEVSDVERMGEWNAEDGQRFGSVVIRGELVASANAPGGWALVRTYENKGDEAAHCQVEERIMRTETIHNARVTPNPVAVLERHQTLDLKPHEKRSIGIFVSPELGTQLTASRRAQQGIDAQLAAGKYDGGALDRVYATFAVDYLRPLARGETAMKPEVGGPMRPARMPGPPSLAPLLVGGL